MTSFADRGQSRYNPPKGAYRVRIIRMWAGTVGAGKQKTTAQLSILDGPERGNEFTHWMDLEGGYDFAERSLAMYGLPASVLEADDDLERLNRDLQVLVGVEAWVSITYRDGFTTPNVTVDGAQTRIGDVTPADPQPSGFEAARAASSGDEPAPF